MSPIHARSSSLRASALALLFSTSLFVGPAAAAPELRSAFEDAWALYEAGQPSFEAFQQVLDDLTQPAKDRFNAAYVLAVQSLAQREAERALALCERADALLAGRPQVALRRSEALIHLGRLDEAQAAFGALVLDGRSTASVRLRHALTEAKLRHALGASDVALEILKRVADENPADWEPFYLMALVYEAWDLPEDALGAYERAIANDPGRDPFPGIYAYQRWAALLISIDPASYDDKPKKETALARYRRFLERAEANHVPANLVEQVRQAVYVLENFGA